MPAASPVPTPLTSRKHASSHAPICPPPPRVSRRSEYAHKLEGELGHKPRFLVQVRAAAPGDGSRLPARARSCCVAWRSNFPLARLLPHPLAPSTCPHLPACLLSAQGTLYPDVIESCPPPGKGQKHSHTIKSHHNVGGLPEDLQFELIEPLRELFKVGAAGGGWRRGMADVGMCACMWWWWWWRLCGLGTVRRRLSGFRRSLHLPCLLAPGLPLPPAGRGALAGAAAGRARAVHLAAPLPWPRPGCAHHRRRDG